MKYSFTCLLLLLVMAAQSQLLQWSPSFITEGSSNAIITANATFGNKGLLGHTANDVYVHIGVITNLSTSAGNWQHVQTSWQTTDSRFKAVPLGNNKWSYTLPGNLRDYFGIPANSSEKILKIAILFHSGDDKLANADGSDMYVPVYEAGLQSRITYPYRQPTFVPQPENYAYVTGDTVHLRAKASNVASLELFFNGTSVATAIDSTIQATAYAVTGNNQLVVKATNGLATAFDTLNFFINTPVVTKDLPAGVSDGINYGSDGTSVTLVLYAPNKTRAAVIGDFNNWIQTQQAQLYRTTDGNRYWITLTGLTSGREYAYQYVVDGNIKIADMYAEKVLDPDNDPYIDAATYPNLKPYPAGQSGIVSVLQTAKPAYSWQAAGYTRPDMRNLVIYELLVRDFVGKHNWQTVKDSISYLKKLGVNAIEVMPFNEFEGNSSWGYNPNFYFAPDKYYGTEMALRQFIDECHRQGIAVIMDMVLNHAFGTSPTVRLYWDAANNRPAANNPWHNPVPKHPYNVGFDFNHESAATQYLVDRVIAHWLTSYKIDGFRWDLSKGFTQTNYGTSENNVGAWSQYDAGRIATWKRIYNQMQAVVPGSYCILEHFADNREESELASYGMMLWGNLNHNYNEATMGWLGSSNLADGLYTQRNWTNPNLVTYMESHDEERLMYKNEQFGNSSGNYNVKDLATGLRRNEMATAFWATQPAPKLLWQFGEMGYDYSINTCEDEVTVDKDCRLSPKPIRWDYLQQANRLALHNVYAKLFALRNYAPYLPAFTAGKDSISYSLAAGFKWQKISSAPLDILVIGNFDVVQLQGSVTFQHPGTWYDYLRDSAFTVSNTTQAYTLKPGEYHVFVDQQPSVVLPVQLVRFTATRAQAAINLGWNVTGEQNMASYVIERSLNGRDYTAIGTVAASGSNTYNFADKATAALQASNNVLYRIRMVDKDGMSSVSAVAVVYPASNAIRLFLYPNPVQKDQVFIGVNENLQGKITIHITDGSGRVCLRQTATIGNGSSVPLFVGQLANGVYHLQLVDDKGNIARQKLMIQR